MNQAEIAKQASTLGAFQDKLDELAIPRVPKKTVAEASNVPVVMGDLENPMVYQKTKALAETLGKKPSSHVEYVIEVGKDDVLLAERKKKLAELSDFDTWIGLKYDPFTNPATQKWLQEVYPEYYENRQKANENLHKLKLQWENVCLNGPKSKEDLFLIFRMQNDAVIRKAIIDTATGFVAGEDSAVAAADFERGLFNSRKVPQGPNLTGAIPEGNRFVHAKAGLHGAVGGDFGVVQRRHQPISEGGEYQPYKLF